MAVYFVGSYDITDLEAFESYVPQAQALLEKYGAEVIVADFDALALEGEKKSSYVVLRFESEQVALDWYNDPDYERVKKIRLDATSNGNVVLAKAFTPPEA